MLILRVINFRLIETELKVLSNSHMGKEIRTNGPQ